MKTDTTFPLTKDELVDLYKNGYIAYGYEDNDSRLIAKVGFSKEGANKVELDVCIHPNNPALKLYKRIGFQAIKDNEGNYSIQNTSHGPRITMNYEK